MVRVLVLGGTEGARARIARQFRRPRGMRIDMAGPLQVGLCLLDAIPYDLVVAFFEPDLATRFAKACLANRIAPSLAVVEPGLRHQCTHLQRVLAAVRLPPATFLRRMADGEDVTPILAVLAQATSAPGAAISGQRFSIQQHAARSGSGPHQTPGVDYSDS